MTKVMLEAYESIRAQRNEFYRQIMTEAGVPLEQRQQAAESRRGGDRYAEAASPLAGAIPFSHATNGRSGTGCGVDRTRPTHP